MASSSTRKSFAYYTTGTWHRKLVAWGMLFCYLTQPVLASAEVVADTKAPPANTPTIQTAPNGVPVVQIAAPTPGGVSHNLYQTFNVDLSGLILNNSRTIAQTQLAGYITGNPNLANGSARIILNEVTSSNPSYLRGYTEVAGQKAEVILANPNGIYGDGFGFINTSRAVLTTGTPVFGGSGSLEAFRVTGGQISVQGKGMDATAADRLDLISKTILANAGIWAKELNAVTGSNQVAYNDLRTEVLSTAESQPLVALDVGELGGMYANKIKLVGTEKGIGVHNQGSLAAGSGDLILTQEGKIQIGGAVSAGADITISSNDTIVNTGHLYAGNNAEMTAGNTIENTGLLAAGQDLSVHAQSLFNAGTIGAGVHSDGTTGTDGKLRLMMGRTISSTGQIVAGGDLVMEAAAITANNMLAGKNASLTAMTGDVDHTGGLLAAKDTLTVAAQGSMVNRDRGTIMAGQINITADMIHNQDSEIVQTGKEAIRLQAVHEINNANSKIAANGQSVL